MVTSQVLDILKNRQTCRSFSSTPVESDKIQILKEALEYSPSKQNTYPCQVRILGPNAVEEKEQLYTTTHCAPQFPNMYNPQILAPVVFLFLADENLSQIWDKKQYKRMYKYAYLQSGLSAMALVAVAEEIGLDTGFVAALDASIPLQGIDYEERVLFGVGVGYHRDDVPERHRCRPDQSANSAHKTDAETKPNFGSWVTEVGF